LNTKVPFSICKTLRFSTSLGDGEATVVGEEVGDEEAVAAGDAVAVGDEVGEVVGDEVTAGETVVGAITTIGETLSSGIELVWQPFNFT
jgi:predicted thioesterase